MTRDAEDRHRRTFPTADMIGRLRAEGGLLLVGAAAALTGLLATVMRVLVP